MVWWQHSAGGGWRRVRQLADGFQVQVQYLRRGKADSEFFFPMTKFHLGAGVAAFGYYDSLILYYSGNVSPEESMGRAQPVGMGRN